MARHAFNNKSQPDKVKKRNWIQYIALLVAIASLAKAYHLY